MICEHILNITRSTRLMLVAIGKWGEAEASNQVRSLRSLLCNTNVKLPVWGFPCCESFTFQYSLRISDADIYSKHFREKKKMEDKSSLEKWKHLTLFLITSLFFEKLSYKHICHLPNNLLRNLILSAIETRLDILF